MKIDVRSGAAIAAAAATLLIAGAALSAPTQIAQEGIGHCNGANSCKGKGACKTASNACKGQNACKGKGFPRDDEGRVRQDPGGGLQPDGRRQTEDLISLRRPSNTTPGGSPPGDHRQIAYVAAVSSWPIKKY